MRHQTTIKLVVRQGGGYAALARALGIKYQSIQRWTKVPAERVRAVERITGIPREQLRPDLYAK